MNKDKKYTFDGNNFVIAPKTKNEQIEQLQADKEQLKGIAIEIHDEYMRMCENYQKFRLYGNKINNI